MRIYLDNCSFNRPYDDQSLLINHIESIAKLQIQALILSKKYEYVWSDILEMENDDNPHPNRRERINKWKDVAIEIIHSDNNVINKAKEFVTIGIKPKDSLHIASAVAGGCEYFITTDKGIIKKSRNISDIKIINPVEFIEEMEV